MGTTTTSSTYNAANQLTATGTTTYTHDANGNMTGSSAGLGATYNAKDQTTSMKAPGYAALPFGYADATQAERVTAGSGTKFTHGILGLSVISNSVGSTYYTRDNQGRLIAERSSTGANYYYLFDGLGSTAAVTDSAATVVSTFKYEPYGKVRAQTSRESRYKFIGQFGAYDDLAHTGHVKMGL